MSTTGTNFPNFFGTSINNAQTNPQDWWKLFSTGIGVQDGNQTLVPGGGGISGLGGMITGFADLIGANKRIGDQQDLVNAAQEGIDDFYSTYKKGGFDPKLSQGVLDAYSFGMRKPDTSGIQSSTQTALSAASSDPRLLGGMIGNIQKNQAQMMNQASQQAAMQQQQQMMGLGQAQQGILDRQNALDLQMGRMKYGEDYAAKQQAMQNIEALKQQKRDAWGNIINSGVNLGMTLAGMPAFPSGEEGMKTPGEFSHDSNPIHMLDNDGNKVGEVTGGEYVLNPQQSDSIEDAYESINKKMETGKKVTKDDLMYLYETVRGIFSQPQFKD